MTISVIGTGYVGLVTATCLAEIGNDVLCIDTNQEKIDGLKNGHIPIYEPGLEEMVKRNAKVGRLTFSTDTTAFATTDIVFIAVGTPPGKNGLPDLKYVNQVVRQIGRHLNHKTVVVNKSTVPIGTGVLVEQAISAELQRRRKKIPFAVLSNPEFLKEGAALDDFMHPDRVVIGSTKPWATAIMQQLYAPFAKDGHPILVISRESAEMAKYASNAMLATKISFMNQMANMSELLGADIEEVREAMTYDVRIGKHFLYAGVGYGGSCFPKDVQALNALAKSMKHAVPLLEAVEQVNHDQKKVLPKKISKALGNLKNKRIALWGLAFKPNTDDIREAPSITIIEELLRAGAKIVAYDPKAAHEIAKIFGSRVEYARDKYIACQKADALVVVTEWSEFHQPDFKKLKRLMKKPIIFDGRNVYDPVQLKKMGWTYYGIGR